MRHVKLAMGFRFPHRANRTGRCVEPLDILSRVHRCAPLQRSRARALAASSRVRFRLRLPPKHSQKAFIARRKRRTLKEIQMF